MTEQKKPDSSATATSSAYKVDVRCIGKPLVLDGDHVVASDWRPLPLLKIESPFGVAYLRPEDELTYTMSYHAAIAVAASFLSRHHYHYGIECRLVEYQRVITHTLTRIGEETLLDAVRESFAIAAASREGS